MELLRKHLLREGHINKPELMEIIASAGGLLSKSHFLFGSSGPKELVEPEQGD